MLTKQDRSYIDQKIEDLAIMIQKGFQECVTKTEFNEKIEGLESRMDGLETRMSNLEGKMNTLEFKLITAPNNRLDRIEDDVRQIKAKIGID